MFLSRNDYCSTVSNNYFLSLFKVQDIYREGRELYVSIQIGSLLLLITTVGVKKKFP